LKSEGGVARLAEAAKIFAGGGRPWGFLGGDRGGIGWVLGG